MPQLVSDPQQVVENTLNEPLQQPSDESSPRRTWLLRLAICVATTAAYSNSLHAPFLFDDTGSIVENPHIRQLWPLWQTLATPAESTVDGRPLVALTLAANYALGGLNPFGYHVTNLLIHLITALVVFATLTRILREAGMRSPVVVSFWTSLIWAVHPLLTESVTYTVQRTELLMGLFLCLTLYSFVRAKESPRPLLWWGLSILFSALGMCCKEVMVVAPLIVLAYDILLRSKGVSKAIQSHWKVYVGLSATWSILALMVMEADRTRSAGWQFSDISMFDYLRTQTGVITHYIRLSIWPHPLVLDYYDWPIAASWSEVLLPLLGCVVLLSVTVVSAFKRPTIAMAGLWFFLILAPTSSLLPIVTEPAAERRMYLPLIALLAIIVGVVHGWLPRFFNENRARGFRMAASAAWVAVAAACVLGTIRRNADYATAERIWEQTRKFRPDNPRALMNLATAYFRNDKVDQAIEVYRRAGEIEPDSPFVAFNLGRALEQAGQRDGAYRAYARAIELDPLNDQALSNLAGLLIEDGKFQEALSFCEHALRIRPSGPTHHNLATAHLQLGNANEALVHYSKAITLTDRAASHQGLANAYLRSGDAVNAQLHLRQAIQRNPNDAKSYQQLGVLLVKASETAEGIDSLVQATRLAPQWSQPFASLGTTFLQLGELDQAVIYYRKALALEPERAAFHFNLAAVLARQGMNQPALHHFQQAVRLKPDFVQAHYNLARLNESAGNAGAAITNYRNALKHLNDFPAAALALGRLLVAHPDASLRSAAEATVVAEELLAQDDQNVIALDLRAAAYAEAGDFPSAVKTIEQAIQVAKTDRRSGLVGGLIESLQSRKKLYESMTPYRQPTSQWD